MNKKKYRSTTKKGILLALSLLLILPVWNIGKGILHYSNGTAKLKLIGYPSPEFANINKEFRIENESLGCTSLGIEHLTSFRYNQTIKFLINSFGYQKNSYSGVFPTIEEAKVFLSNGNFKIGKTELIKNEKIRIETGKEICQIDLNLQHGLIRSTLKESEMVSNPKLKMVEDCLIVQLNNSWIYLIELKNRKIIAQYRV